MVSARTRDYLTRAQLDSALTAAQKAGRKEEIFVLQNRLKDGDFKQGDRIVYLQRVPAPALPAETLKVAAAKMVKMPNIDQEFSLDGVLRSELKAHMMKFLVPNLFKTADFDVTPLVRLSLQGRVQRPGPFYVPADLLLSDVLTLAILAPDADTKKIEIRRGGGTDVLWDPVAVQAATGDGLSVDDLGLLDNDEINVGQKKTPFNYLGALQITMSSMGLIFTIINLARRR